MAKFLPALLSFLFPGVGQFYNGQWKKGIVLLLLMFLPTWGLLNIYSAYDAWKNARIRDLSPNINLPPLPQIPWKKILPLLAAILISAAAYALLVFWLFLFVIKPGSSASSESGRDPQIEKISSALGQWKSEKGTYPASLGELISGKPLRKSWNSDAWGRPYEYRGDSTSFEMRSSGPDRQPETPDDIEIKP